MVAYGLSLEIRTSETVRCPSGLIFSESGAQILQSRREEMRQVHLGRRLDDSMICSQRTYELDAETTVSALRDVIATHLNAAALHARMESIK
jgi:hypothetical protein